MIEIVEKHLNGMQIPFEYKINDLNRHSFYFDLKLKKGIIQCVIGVNYQEEYALLCFLNPTPFPENRKAEVSEYLHRVNYNIPQGAFIIDYNIHNVGFHTYFSLTNDEFHNDNRFIEAFKFAKDIMDEYFHGVLTVGYGEKKPEDVLYEILLGFNPRWN
ncbi:MAG: hypothetical protein WD511_00880 [Balneolaceae bacterium]